MSHRIRRLFVIDQTVTLFRDILQKAGVQASAYHVPDWEETPAGLEKLLDETLRVTPPTALVCWTIGPVNGVLGWLVRHGLHIPRDVSLVSIGQDAATSWFYPGLNIASVQSDVGALQQAIVKWLAGVAVGKPDQRQSWSPLSVEEGNSLGPAKTI